MGMRGTARRSTDGHLIHCNVDTDVILAEEPADGSVFWGTCFSYILGISQTIHPELGTAKPDELYYLIERFSLGRRRLQLFGNVSILFGIVAWYSIC